jgi:predicted dehydrogenase
MKKVNIAVVGLNFGRKLIEGHLLRGRGAEYFQLSAVCDHQKKLCDEAAEDYGVKAYYKLEDLLDDDEIPVTVLVTGPNGRADLLRQIIHAGKDCITTKPFELDAGSAASVLAEARALGRFIYLNSPPPVDTLDFQIIREWRKRYDLGMAVGGHHESWYKVVEEADGCWYDDPSRCPAAPVLRLGIYGINDLVRILGEADEIQVMQTRLFTGRPTPDYARMNIKFKSGAIADTLNGYVTSPERHESSLILYFERGTIYRNPPMLPGNSIRYNTVDSTYMCLCMGDKSDGMPIETIRIKNEELSLGYKWEVFHKAVTTRQRPEGETPDDVIVNSLRVFGAIKEASETGGTVKVARIGLSIPENACHSRVSQSAWIRDQPFQSGHGAT